MMYDNIMNNDNIDLYFHRDWCTSDDLDIYIKNWDLNTNILTKLEANFVSGSSPSQYKKKVFFFMHIQVLNVAVELSSSGLDTFFSSELTLQQAQQITSWGSGNPPGYVKSSSYGMYAVLSADWNPTTDGILKLLETSSNTIAMTKTLFTKLA